MLGSHLLKSWSTTQSQVALSSGEAEYYGVVKASGIALGYQSLLHDLGVSLALRVWTDSTATIGICSRTGLGRLRHIDTQCLWLQDKVRSGALELRKVKGTENPADLFTKHLTSAPCVEALLGLFGCFYQDGRPAAAPQLRAGAGSQAGAKLNIAEVAYQHGLEEDTRVAELMTIEGHTFPMVKLDDYMVPEAWSYDQKVLPHLQPDEARLFPRAAGAPDAGGRDPPARSLMGDRWADIDVDTVEVLPPAATATGSAAPTQSPHTSAPHAVHCMYMPKSSSRTKQLGHGSLGPWTSTSAASHRTSGAVGPHTGWARVTLCRAMSGICHASVGERPGTTATVTSAMARPAGLPLTPPSRASPHRRIRTVSELVLSIDLIVEFQSQFDPCL